LQEELLLSKRIEWDATDRYGALVGNGEYLLVLSLLDQGRNFRRVEASVRVE
jgi:hypothetical protein